MSALGTRTFRSEAGSIMLRVLAPIAYRSACCMWVIAPAGINAFRFVRLATLPQTHFCWPSLIPGILANHN